MYSIFNITLICHKDLPLLLLIMLGKLWIRTCGSSMGIFPDAERQLTPQSLVRSGRILNSHEMLWISLLPADMKKIRSKRSARVLTTLYINFSDVQGQITLELVVVSGRNLDLSKLSCMSLLPARMRMIDSKMK